MNMLELAAQILICPDCGAGLDETLKCSGCGRLVTQDDGILEALPNAMLHDHHDQEQLVTLVHDDGPGAHGERVVLFEKAFHDGQAAYYDQIFAEPMPLAQYYRRLVYHHIYRYVRPAPFVVDLCCGTGKSSIPLLDRGLTVVGIDVSIEMLRAYQTKCRNRGYEKILLIHADASRPPLLPGCCLAMSVVGGLHHIQDRTGCLQNWCTALADSGVLVVHEPLNSGQRSKLAKIMENIYALATPSRVARALKRRLVRQATTRDSIQIAHEPEFTPFEKPFHSPAELLSLLPETMTTVRSLSRGDLSFRNFPRYLQSSLGVPLAWGVVALDDYLSERRRTFSGDALFAVFRKVEQLDS